MKSATSARAGMDGQQPVSKEQNDDKKIKSFRWPDQGMEVLNSIFTNQ
jgi:hypothetical protein